MKQAFETVKQLVQDFKNQETAYLSSTYQESQVRQDFIDKFFTALGWDVAHNVQKNPYEQEVHIENRVHMAGSQRRADYAFFLLPNFRDPKFFVEAKKPSRNLANPDDYYQTIRYGWNAGTPIAVLTDFEEFHILDCRYKPDIKGVMSQKIEYFHYSDYANEEKFARIYWLFSREAVVNGSLEKEAAKLQRPRGKAIQQGLFKGGYQSVDEAFLEQLDDYREILAKAFKKTNPDLNSEELTEAVQRTIDRLVFIRFLEDKQIEEPEIINLRSKKSAWGGFLALCRRFDPKYNGLIFKPHKVLEGKKFIPPDDEAFVRICDELADPTSPYNFDQIPISILGSIYERFLGKVIHATDQQARVQVKPEVRKAGGVYYTPEYIVRYIVDETVGKLIEGKTPESIANMAFADIACGSGSFLIEVYNRLLENHIRYYNTNPDKQKDSNVFERDGKLHLTLKKKKEILVNNVYGVDVDFQATEVTQLSLYLKMLEDVTMYDAHQFGMFKETILPDLRTNVINGNSLIGRDIIEGELFANVDENKLKPMNFEEAFPLVMTRGGFDAIVGNPPYRIIQPHNTEINVIEYMRKHFVAADFKVDLFHLFLQKAIINIKNHGLLGYIVPTTILNNVYVENLRKWILNQCAIESIAVAKGKVFEDADVHTSVLTFRKENKSKDRNENEIKTSVELTESFASNPIFASSILQQTYWELSGGIWNVLVNNANASLIQKLNQYTPLKDFAYINRGLITGDRDKYFSKTKKNKDYVKIIGGGDVHRYYALPPSEYVLFKRPETSGGCWDKDVHFASHKLVIRQIGTRPTATILREPLAVTGNIFTIMCKELQDELFILGIINSSILSFYWKTMFSDFKDSFPQVTIFSLSQLPIYKVTADNAQGKIRHDHIVKLVEQILDAKEKMLSAKTEAETNRLELLCQTLDRQIDDAVYELYGFTEDEIRIVERGNEHF